MRLPEDAALIFAPGSPPIYGTKIRYYIDQEFSVRAKPAPPRYSDRINCVPESPGTPAPDQSHKNQFSGESKGRPLAVKPAPEEREQVLKVSGKEWLFK